MDTDTRIWFKVENQGRWADVLMFRGQEVWTMSVVGDIKGLKHKLEPALEALQAGQDPRSLKADWVKSINAQATTKAEVSPENDKLTLYHGEKGSKTMMYSTSDKNADVILPRSGKSFQPVEVEISASEAVGAPIGVEIVAAVLLALIYANAGMAAGGKPAEIEGGGRFINFLRMLNWLGQLLGPMGTIAVGVGVLIVLVAWAMRLVKHRAKRTVWMPAQS